MADLTLNPNMQNLGGLLAKHYPRRGILLFKLLEDIKTGFSSLSIETRDSILSYSAMLNQRCLPMKALNKRHAETGSRQCLKADSDEDLSDAKLKVMLNFVNKLTLCPEQITQDDVQRLYDMGWSQREFLDSVYLRAIANCMNSFIHGLKFAGKNQLDRIT